VSRVYFTDRDLGKQFPRILAEAGIVVERHLDLFRPEGIDEEWLEHCGTKGRVAVSHNSRIRYVPNELEAVKRFKVPLLILVGQVTSAELARNARRVGKVRRSARPRGVLVPKDLVPPEYLARNRAASS
jgi:hypothetical protein